MDELLPFQLATPTDSLGTFDAVSLHRTGAWSAELPRVNHAGVLCSIPLSLLESRCFWRSTSPSGSSTLPPNFGSWLLEKLEANSASLVISHNRPSVSHATHIVLPPMGKTSRRIPGRRETQHIRVPFFETHHPVSSPTVVPNGEIQHRSVHFISYLDRFFKTGRLLSPAGFWEAEALSVPSAHVFWLTCPSTRSGTHHVLTLAITATNGNSLVSRNGVKLRQ